MGLDSISSIDGRYSKNIQILKEYFSEYALIRKRLFIELEYLKKLGEFKVVKINREAVKKISKLIEKFDLKEAEKIKKIEKKTHHDVKSVEYYLQEKFTKKGLSQIIPFIHFGLTSTDVNNLSTVLSVKEFREELVINLERILKELKRLALKNKDVVIIGRTHGQPAVPTTFGKEMANYYKRISKRVDRLKNFQFEGKLNGAVGNYNAQSFAYPRINWIKFSKSFLKDLGLTAEIYSTQILPYDNLVEFFQMNKIVNGILLDFAQDIWIYNMLGIVKLEKGSSVGSSTMPQKVNPIEFENAEGNLHITNGLIEVYERRLLTSRLQRDLSDSTITRSFGEMFGHQLVAWQNIQKGLAMIRVEKSMAEEQLENNWEVLAEAIQTYLRTQGNEKAYDLVKKKTQGKKLNKEEYQKLINGELHLKKNNPLAKLKPQDYTGLAKELVEKLFKK